MNSSYNGSVNQPKKEEHNTIIIENGKQMNVKFPNLPFCILDGKDGYTSGRLRDEGKIPVDKILVPNCGKDYLPLHQLNQKSKRCILTKESMNALLKRHASEGRKFSLIWGDYCGTLQGNVDLGIFPMEDIELIFSHHLLPVNSIFAITLNVRGHKNQELIKQASDVVEFYSKNAKVKANLLWSDAYGPNDSEHGMVFIMWVIAPWDGDLATRPGVDQARIDFIRNDIKTGKKPQRARSENLSERKEQTTISKKRSRSCSDMPQKRQKVEEDDEEGKILYRECEKVGVHDGPFISNQKVFVVSNDDGTLNCANIDYGYFDPKTKGSEWEKQWYFVNHQDGTVEEVQQVRVLKYCDESREYAKHRNAHPIRFS